MGWNSWNKFVCNVSEQLIKEIADAMVTSGMKKAGYQYVNIDDCWQVSRDSAGNIVADPVRFPNGIKALADYVHSKGLKLGIYTDAGTMTCEKRPGSLDHEAQDAKTYAGWGVDYVKIDWCNTDKLDPQKQYAKFRDALASCGRPIVFSICNWGRNQPWTWGPATGNLWRTTGDIQDKWASVLKILDNPSQQHADAARPGAWNDPDMLEVGNGKMTDTEYRSHFGLWAIMAAPLIAGNDLRSMTQATKDILMNAEVIAVDQDAAGKQGTRVRADGGLEVWAKPLKQKGTVAVALFNRSEADADVSASWSDVGLPPGKAKVRDLWAHADRGVFSDSFKANVPSHGVVMLKIVSAR
jgi:alpha-galactosidase